jgi:C4-dicarboxylate-specific signal transduction histidine kinase
MVFSLRQQVLAICAALTLVVIGALFYASRLTYQEQVVQLQGETLAMTSTVLAYLERNIQSADAVAQTAARHPAVQELQRDAAVEVLRPLTTSGRGFRNIVVADLSGRSVAWVSPPAAEVEGQMPLDWLAGVGASGRPGMSGVLGPPAHGVHAIVFAYPIGGASGKPVGALGLVVHLEALEDVLTNIPLPKGSVITVTDERSVVVARSLESARYVGRPVEETQRTLRPIRQVPRTDLRTGVDGVERVYGNAVVERGPWLVSVGIPTAVAAARTAPIYRRDFAIVLGAIGVILALALYLVHRWLAALHEVGRAAERVSKGDLSPLEPKSLGAVEINQLYTGISGMINSLRGAQEAVAAQMSEERRVREEKESLQRQLIRQERLAAIGVLVSGVAHELNNPLQAIMGFSELLQLHRDVPEPVRQDLSLIRRESARASGIIRNLQRFGRQTSEPSPVKLSDVVASVLELRQRKIESQGIRLDIEDQSEATVSAVFTELQQVVLNFLINAEQAVLALDEPRRRVKVRTSDGRNSARLEVEDHGDGVPPADEAKLFQPFFTTKPVGEGTGLGLSVSYGIITSHGGEIGYRRSHTGGAIFYFELPTK